MTQTGKVITSNFVIDFERNCITLSSKESIKLNHIENKILALLYTEPERVFSREEIFNYAWGNSDNFDSVVPQAISLLRKKLYKYHIDLIETIKGKGYQANSALIFQEDVIQKKSTSIFKNHYVSFFLGATLTAGSIYFIPTLLTSNEDELTSQPIEQNLDKVKRNIFIPSTSLPITYNENELNDDVLYVFNRSIETISISACLIDGNSCSDFYNELVFYSDSRDENIDDYISHIKFDGKMPQVTHDNDQRFRIGGKIYLSSATDPQYSGLTYLNYDVTKIDEQRYESEFSSYIHESGYEGSYSLSVDLRISRVPVQGKSIFYVKGISSTDNMIQGRNHYGMVKDQTKIYLYPFLFNKSKQNYFTHSYHLKKNFSYVYKEAYGAGMILFEYN